MLQAAAAAAAEIRADRLGARRCGQALQRARRASPSAGGCAEPHAPALARAGRAGRYTRPSGGLADAVAAGAQAGEDDLDLARHAARCAAAHGAPAPGAGSGGARRWRRRPPARTGPRSGARPSRTSCEPASVAWAISRPGRQVDGRRGGAAAAGGRSLAALAPRWTSAQIRVAVPPTSATAPTTTNTLSALRRESDIPATGEAPSGRIELAPDVEHEGPAARPVSGRRACRELSRSRLQGLVREGHLRQGGRSIAEPGRRVKPGERFELDAARAARPPACGRGAWRSRSCSRTSICWCWSSRRGWWCIPRPAMRAARWSTRCSPIAAASLSGIGGVSGRGSSIGSTARSAA